MSMTPKSLATLQAEIRGHAANVFGPPAGPIFSKLADELQPFISRFEALEEVARAAQDLDYMRGNSKREGVWLKLHEALSRLSQEGKS